MKNNQRGSIGLPEVGLAIVLVTFAAFVVWRIAESDNAANDSATNSLNASQTIANESIATSETTQPAAGEEAITDNSEEITLEAKNGYKATGTATRSFNDNGFRHEVIMQAGAPAEGKFYEGWLVGGPDGFVSTGELTEEEDGIWSLNFTSDKDMSEYNQVVITEETSANGFDKVPETHILEGSFSN